VAGSAIYTVGQVLHLGIDVSPTVNLKITRSNSSIAPFSFLLFLPGSFGDFRSYRCSSIRFDLLFSNIFSVKRSVHYQRGVKASQVHCFYALIFFSNAVTSSLFRCPTQHGIDIQASYGKTPTQRNHHICLSFRLPRSTQCSQIYMHVTLRVCHGEAVPSVSACFI